MCSFPVKTLPFAFPLYNIRIFHYHFLFKAKNLDGYIFSGMDMLHKGLLYILRNITNLSVVNTKGVCERKFHCFHITLNGFKHNEVWNAHVKLEQNIWMDQKSFMLFLFYLKCTFLFLTCKFSKLCLCKAPGRYNNISKQFLMMEDRNGHLATKHFYR